MLKTDGKHLPSPVLLDGQLCVVFFRSSSFHNADIATVTGIGTAQKIMDLEHRTLYIQKCFEVSKHINIQYCIVAR